jgi:hypothetical protein
MYSSYSAAKNMQEIAEVKLTNCGLEVTDFRKNCDCGISELRLSNIPLKVGELRLRTPKKLRVPTSDNT